MKKLSQLKMPTFVEEILSETTEMAFDMISELQVASLLQTLAASKPGGHFLELGTGTGFATAFLLNGMDQNAKLISVENDPTVAAIAQKYLTPDTRLSLHIEDAGKFISAQTHHKQLFDLIFADTWVGKFTHLEATLALLKPGGFYIVDDLLPQANWPDHHEANVADLIADLENRTDLLITKIPWTSGLIIGTKLANSSSDLSTPVNLCR